MTGRANDDVPPVEFSAAAGVILPSLKEGERGTTGVGFCSEGSLKSFAVGLSTLESISIGVSFTDVLVDCDVAAACVAPSVSFLIELRETRFVVSFARGGEETECGGMTVASGMLREESRSAETTDCPCFSGCIA